MNVRPGVRGKASSRATYGVDASVGSGMDELLPANPASARRARRFVGDALHRLQWEAGVDLAELLVSELVTNAVLHAGTAVRLRVQADRGAGVPVSYTHLTLPTIYS